MWNLRNKLLIPILSMVIIGLCSVSLISYFMSSKALEEAILNDAKGSARNLRDLIGVIMEGSQSDSDMLSKTSLVYEMMNPQQDNDSSKDALEVSLQGLIEKNPFYLLIHVIDKDGVVVATSASTTKTENLKERVYFQEAMRGKTDYIGEPIKSISTGRSSLPVSQPIMVDGKPAGVLLVNIDLATFSDTYVKSISLGKRGYAFLLSGLGEVLAHPNTENILSPEMGANTAIQRLKKETSPQGNFLAEFEGQETFYAYEREPVTGWFCVVRADTDDIYGSITSLGIASAVISTLVAMLIALVIFLVVRSVVSSLKEGVTFAAAVAHGNLDNTLSVKRGDEIGALADALRTMVIKLKEMIETSDQKTAEAVEQTEKAKQATEEAEEARQQAEQAKSQGMRQAGQNLAAIAGHIDQTAKELVEHVRRAAEGSEAQKFRTTETATAMEEMNSTVIEVSRNATAASNSAETAKQNAEDGAKIVAEVIEAITEVDQKTGELKVNLNALGEQAQGIGQVMGVITDIADQTNLLALNAAIEAARAGEAGRGFAVVADEVRKLAEKTMAATMEVGDAVRAIQTGTISNIASMEDASKSVVKSTEMVRHAGDSLKAIVDISDATADEIRSIATASTEQSAASEEITNGTEQIARIAEETSIQMNQAQNSVQRLSDLIEEINNLVNVLQQA